MNTLAITPVSSVDDDPRPVLATLPSPERVAVVGLGYVGLPLAVALGTHDTAIGLDVDPKRIDAYREGRDPTSEVSPEAFAATKVEFTTNAERLQTATIIIIAVPTPIDATRRPDLDALREATATVGKNLQPGTIVVFESTVFPGATQDICGPILAQASGLRAGIDFKLAYSPERINPGDAAHSLREVVKIVAAEDTESLERVDAMYRRIVPAGTHRAPTIRVAEAAKVLENTQRDLNIALMNELALIFERADIDTHAVIDAAATKWNFADYRPGLVGGHCIGVDPYYLTHMAEALGYHPDVILAGRRVNDAMGRFVGRATIKQLIAAGKNVAQARVGILGVTFKERVADIRNSRVADIVAELQDHGVEVVLSDPRADAALVRQSYGQPLVPTTELTGLDAVVVAVRHPEYDLLSLLQLRAMCRHNPVLIDVKATRNAHDAAHAGFRYWRL